MALVKEVLKNSLFSGLKTIYEKQSDKATSGKETEDPKAVISQIANDMADVIADAVDAYIKSGDITVSSSNISVTAPNGACVVAPIAPAKMK